MSKRKAIICDLDGTLCLFRHHRGPYDASRCDQDLPNVPVLTIVNTMYRNHGYELIFVSGREDKYREQTVRWLNKHVASPEVLIDINGHLLFMRKTDDNRKDSIIKQEIYDRIKDHFDIQFVLDDRDQVVEMWRLNGLTCLQVAPGNF